MGVKSSGKLVPIIWQKILPHNIHNIINSTEENMIMAKLNCCCDSSIQDVVHLTKVHSGKMGVKYLNLNLVSTIWQKNLATTFFCKVFWNNNLPKNIIRKHVSDRSIQDVGGFHLHLLVFPFIYQFNSRIGVLVNLSFTND